MQQNLVSHERNPIISLFFSGSGMEKNWDASFIAPLILPVQDRSKNTCCFCSHMLAILLVSCLANGNFPFEQHLNQHLQTQGFRGSFIEEELHTGAQGREVCKRQKKWKFPKRPDFSFAGNKRRNDSGASLAKRVKVEKDSEHK